MAAAGLRSAGLSLRPVAPALGSTSVAPWTQKEAAWRAHLEALVDQALLEELLEYPPDRFHEAGVQGFVVILEVNPAPHAPDGCFPLLRVPHHNGPALLIVLVNAHLKHLLLVCDACRE